MSRLRANLKNQTCLYVAFGLTLFSRHTINIYIFASLCVIRVVRCGLIIPFLFQKNSPLKQSLKTVGFLLAHSVYAYNNLLQKVLHCILRLTAYRHGCFGYFGRLLMLAFFFFSFNSSFKFQLHWELSDFCLSIQSTLIRGHIVACGPIEQCYRTTTVDLNSTQLSSWVASAVWTHPSAFVTQFTISCTIVDKWRCSL